ncbi:MAG: universal stress protein [Smithella sp.]|nr:universal stress protein [Smithella sp.]
MYKKILVPLDGSELAEYALPHIKKLAQYGFSPEITLLKVFWVDYPEFRNLQGYPGYVELRKGAENEARQYLSNIKENLYTEGINTDIALLEGNRPASLISDYAQNNEIDLIVIATRGYTGRIGPDRGSGKKLMGSVAIKVLHEACVPVLLIRTESCLEG